jgi:hypothetical protein
MNYPNPPQQPGPYGGGRPPGQQPPPYGQQPYGHQPPPYGQPSTPPHGQQPPPYGQPHTPPGGHQGPPHTPPGGHQGPPPPPPPQPPSDYPPAPSFTPPPSKPSGKGRLLAAIIGVVVIAGVAVAYFVFTRTGVSTAEAGDCIKVNSASETSAEVEKIDCNDPIAVFKVAKKLDSSGAQCPTPDYEKYTQSGGSGPSFALCLMPNAKEGECFANYDTPDKRARAACGPEAEVKVAKLVTGSADEGLCEADSIPLVYPDPATTFCLTQP